MTGHRHLVPRTLLGLALALGSLAPATVSRVAPASAVAASSVAAPTVQRFAGADRYATAAAISRGTFAPGVAAAFVATGAAFADALAAGPAAAARSGPVLLTSPTTLPTATAAELARLDPSTIYVLGGIGAVSEAVRAQLTAYAPSVVRLQGADRYATAAAISSAIFPGGAPVAFVVNGVAWPDATAGGAAAALLGGPVLLTTSTRLPATTVAELTRLAPSRIVVVGGTGVVSTAVETALRGLAARVDRIAGADRYATSAAVATQLFSAGPRPVWFATGGSFPDAVAGVAAAAVEDAPILLAPPSCLGPTSRAAASRFAPARTVLLGGPRVLSGAVGLLEPCPSLATVRLGAKVVFTADSPTQVVARPGSPDLFVAERAGTVRRVVGDVVQSTPYLSLSGVSTSGEGGLLGLAFSPSGDRLYTYLTRARADGGLTIEVWSFRADPTAAAAGRQLLSVAHPFRGNHVSGALAVGRDGDLWIATGDSGGGYDPDNRASDVRYLLGKLMRITPTPTATAPYAIPALNPYRSNPRCSGRATASVTACAEIWAYGLRNPFRLSIDPASGEMWLPDVGQGSREEVNFLFPDDARGRSFGWDYVEGNLRLKAGGPANPLPPLYAYAHSGGSHTGCAITGGMVHRGGLPGLRGAYVFGDFCNPQLWAIEQSGGRLVRAVPIGVSIPGLVALGEDASGRLHAVSLSGSIYRITPG